MAYSQSNIKWVTATRSEYDELRRRTAVTEAYAPDGWQEDNEKLLGRPDQRQASPHTTYKYDAAGRLTQVVNPYLVGTSFHHDALGRQTKVVEAEVPPGMPVPSAGKPTSERQYDAAGRLTRSIDAAKVATAYHLDALGRVTKVVEAEGHKEQQRTTRHSYDATDRLTRQTRGLGAEEARPLQLTTGYGYDALGRQVEVNALADRSDEEVLAELGHVRPLTRLRYDALGRVVQVDERIGGVAGGAAAGWRRTRTAYDALGRPVRVSEGGDWDIGLLKARVREAAYDVAGNRILERDGRGVRTDYDYDRLGRVRITYQGGKGPWAVVLTTELTYWYHGQVESRKTALGTTWYHYDQLGRLRTTTEANGHVVEQDYDRAGNLVRLIDIGASDKRKVTTSYAYDALNRRTGETHPGGAKATVRFDALGRETWRETRRGDIIEVEYDKLGRLRKEQWRRSEKGDQVYRREFEYNLLDGLAQSSVPLNKAQAHLLAGEADPDKKALKHALKYDALGRLRRDQSMGVSQVLAYDAGGRLVKVTDSLGGVTTSDYDAAGRLVRRSLIAAADAPQGWAPDGVEVNWTYQRVDGRLLDRPREVVRSEARPADVSEDRYSLKYDYDRLGRAEAIADTADYVARPPHSPATQHVEEELKYDYNSLGLLRETVRTWRDYKTGRTGDTHTQKTEYDDIGQVKSETHEVVVGGGVTERSPPVAYGFDKQGNRSGLRYADNTNRLSKDGRAKYDYDAGGNLTDEWPHAVPAGQPWLWRYGYDARDRLRDATAAVLGFRLIRSDQVHYLHDAEGRVVRRLEGSYTGSPSPPPLPTKVTDLHYQGHEVLAEQTGGVLRRYLRGEGTDQLLGHQELGGGGPAAYWHFTDAQGSVLRVFAQQRGAPLQMRSYRGLIERTDNAGKQPFGYTGRPTDPITGLRDHRARWLNPRNGRWQSEDPIGFAGGDSNLYRYVGNSWPNASDPSGKIVVGGLIGALIGGAVGGINAYLTGQDIGRGILQGAVIGGVAGLTGGLAFGVTSVVGTGLFGTGAVATVGTTLAAGAIGGAVGDAAGQILGMNLGWQTGGYRWQQTAGAAVGGLVLAPLARVLGNSGRSLAVAGSVGGVATDVATQGLEIVSGQKKWSEYDPLQTLAAAATGALSGRVGSAAQSKVRQHWQAPGWRGRLARVLDFGSEESIARWISGGLVRAAWHYPNEKKGWRGLLNRMWSNTDPAWRWDVLEKQAIVWQRLRGERVYDAHYSYGKSPVQQGLESVSLRGSAEKGNLRVTVSEAKDFSSGPVKLEKFTSLGMGKEGNRRYAQNRRKAAEAVEHQPAESDATKRQARDILINQPDQLHVRLVGGGRTHFSSDVVSEIQRATKAASVTAYSFQHPFFPWWRTDPSPRQATDVPPE